MSDPTNPFPGMNLGSMFGQILESAQQVQGQVAAAQKRSASIELQGTAAGGKVTATATGAGKLRSVRIAPDLTDRELIEDLVVVAVNDALRKAEELRSKEMGQATGGLDLGPLGAMLGKLGG